jgi:hypothetical protein
MNSKQYIINKFNTCVKGVEICLSNANIKHCGKEGHWLETKMEIHHNSKNAPDIMGYEMKKASNTKITLGDFSASEYAFSNKNKRNVINQHNSWTDANNQMNRTEFIKYFGNPNPLKHNRCSWSGSCVPTYSAWNANGQNLLVLDNSDIVIYYSYEQDLRATKSNFPEYLKLGIILIVLWKSDKLRAHINNKFNNNGFFICKKIGDTYESICFGRPFDFDYFIVCIKNKKIIFDSGMYAGNSRNYSHFRGSHFWMELITEEF